MLSQYIINCLQSLNYNVEDERQAAVQYLRAAGENAEKDEDKRVFYTLSGVLSMAYNEQEGEYLPLLVMSDGRRSFAMEDLENSDIEILKEALPHIGLSWIKAQISHVLWIKTDEYTYAQTAVAENLVLFNEAFDPENWVPCYHIINRTFQIAQNCKKKEFADIIQEVDAKIKEMDGTDKGFLSLKLMNLIYKLVKAEKLEHYFELTKKIFDQARKSVTTEPIAKYCVDIQCKLLERLKRKNEIYTLKLELAEYYETVAEEEKSQPFRAIQMLQKAYNLCDKSDSERINNLRRKLEIYQKAALSTMVPIPFKYDIAPVRDQVSNLFSGLSRPEMIIEFGRIARVYDMGDVRQEVLENHKEYLLQSFFSKTVMDKDGRIVKILPPLDLYEPEKDAELFRKHMIACVTEHRNFSESILVQIAYSYIRGQGDIEKKDLDFLVDHNAIIPEDRKDIMKLGLNLGLNGEVYAAMHILLPQTENIIRELAKICGDRVTYWKEDGTEEFKPLSKLLNGTQIRESYDENFLFTLETLLDDRGGPNLRNENAHGLLSPEKGTSGVALCFLSLLIRFLSLYIPKKL